ncbi:MAG: cation:dicarboxylase symporter family transporter, partial [Bacteroidota bacterium]
MDNKSRKRLALHYQILIGIVLGAIIGMVAAKFPGGPSFIRDWIKPIGLIFINLLKLIAVPLIFVSLTKGISDLKDVSKLSRLGLRTIMWYMATTVFAVILGLLLVNFFNPGAFVSQETVANLSGNIPTDISSKVSLGTQSSSSGPLDFFIQLVPANLFAALSDNGRLLQVIFFTIFFSICLLLVPADKQKPINVLIDSLNT